MPRLCDHSRQLVGAAVKFRWFITKKMLVGLIGLLVAALFVMAFLSGCGGERGDNQPESGITAGATLVSIGLWFMYAGSLALGVGIIGRVACLVMPSIAFLGELLGDIAVIGLSSVLLGTSFIWVGNNAWLLAVTVALSVLVVGIRYRTRIARFLGFKKVKEQANA